MDVARERGVSKYVCQVQDFNFVYNDTRARPIISYRECQSSRT